MRVSEIRVSEIRVNQGLGVLVEKKITQHLLGRKKQLNSQTNFTAKCAIKIHIFKLG